MIKTDRFNFITILIIVLISGISIQAQDKEECDIKCDEFIFAFSNPNSLKDTGGIEEIDMISRLHIEGIPGTLIQMGSKKYQIPANGYLKIEEFFPQATYEYSNNTIRLKANTTVFITAERTAQYSTHNFPLIPVSEWGKVYTIPGYKDQSRTYKVNNFIDIMAREKNTSVSIKDNKGSVIKKISLKAGQNYEYYNVNDITGYTIEANKNIGVITGNHCLRISAACDHVALMLWDNTKLGSKYYNPGTSFFSDNTIHRIVGTRNNTQVKIDGKLKTNLNKGEFYEYKLKDPHIIESTFPVLSYLLYDKRSLSDPEYSVDPSSILIPSLDNAVQSVKFAFPEYMIYSKDIRIIMRTDKTHSLLLDGAPVNTEWKTFSADPLVSYATLNFSDENVHTINVSNPDSYFIPFMMGRGLDVSVGSNLKIGFINLLSGKNSRCENSSPVFLEDFPEVKETNEILLKDINIPIVVKKGKIEVMIFDNAEEDGDIISLYLNDKLIYSDVEVLKAGIVLGFDLEKGENIITIKAENEGRIYPNTAGLTFDDGQTLQTIILHNRKGQSKSLKIIFN